LEEEIDLKEVIAVLWKGRYIIIGITAAAMIIAAVVSIFFVTPLYRATAYIDLDDYEDERGVEEFIRRPDRRFLMKSALDDIARDPEALDESVELEESEEYEGFLEVSVSAPAPGLAAEAADQTGLKLLRWAGEYELKQLKSEKESREESLDFFEQQVESANSDRYFSYEENGNDDLAADYVAPSLEILNEELQVKKESLEKELENFDQYILNAFGVLSPQDLEIAMTDMEFTNPAYQIVMEKRGALLTELFEVEYAIEKLERGELPDIAMAEGTVFERVVTRRDSIQSEIMDLSLRISRAEHKLAHRDEERLPVWYEAVVPEEPFNMRWPLNTAVAGVLGLMLSVFIVFIRPYISELTSEIRKTDQENDQ